MLGQCGCVSAPEHFDTLGPDGVFYTERAEGGPFSFPVFSNYSTGTIDYSVSYGTAIDRIINSLPRGAYWVQYGGQALRAGNGQWYVLTPDPNVTRLRWEKTSEDLDFEFYPHQPLPPVPPLPFDRQYVGGPFATHPAPGSTQLEAIANAACLFKSFYHIGGKLSFFVLSTPTLDCFVPWGTLISSAPAIWRVYRAKPLLFGGRIFFYSPGVYDDNERFDCRIEITNLSRGRWYSLTNVAGAGVTANPVTTAFFYEPRTMRTDAYTYHANTTDIVLRASFDDGSGGANAMPGQANSELPAIEWHLKPIVAPIYCVHTRKGGENNKRRLQIRLDNTGLGCTSKSMKLTFENNALVTFDNLVWTWPGRLGGLHGETSVFNVTNSPYNYFSGGLLSNAVYSDTPNENLFQIPGGRNFSGPVEIAFTITDGPVNHGRFVFTVNLPKY